MKKKLTVLAAFLVLSYLVFFPKQSLEASALGLNLWFQTMLPTLLPFMVLANLIIELNLIDGLTGFFYRFAGPLFHIGIKGCFVLLLGYVCGYPMGAKACGDLVRRGELSVGEGQYLLGFCNNASPAYMLNYVLYTSLHVEKGLFPFLLCIYVPPLCFGLLGRHLLYGGKDFSGPSRHAEKKCRKMAALSACSVSPGDASSSGLNIALVESCMMNAFLNMTRLGGYMILFSLIASMCFVLPGMNDLARSFVMMLLEITNGTAAAAGGTFPAGLKLVLILGGNAFGGLSCLAQTQSMIQGTGLSAGLYIRDKLLIGALTSVMACVWLF